MAGSDNGTPDICPVGHHCPQGSPAGVPCSAGTLTNTEGLTSQAECEQCTPGYYCNDTGMCNVYVCISSSGLFGKYLLTQWFDAGLTAAVDLCDAGFYCPGGDDVANPVDTPCPIGLHCPVGTSVPVPCVAGTYANYSQGDSCETCPAGYYCVPEEVVEGIKH